MVSTVIASAGIFLAGLAGTVIGIGWRLNRNRSVQNRQRINSVEDGLGSLVQILGGSEMTEGELEGLHTKIDEMQDQMEASHEHLSEDINTVMYRQRTVIRELNRLDDVEDFQLDHDDD